MKNADTWKFAQEHCGRLWRKLGCVLLAPSFLIHASLYRANEATLGIVGCVLATVQCVVLIASVFQTDSALKRKFGS